MVSPAAAEAPLCKGNRRRRRLRDCLGNHSMTTLRHGIRRAITLCTREAKISRNICGCGENLQMSEVSVGFSPAAAAAPLCRRAVAEGD